MGEVKREIMMAIVDVIHAWRRWGWEPRRLALSVEDFWLFRDEVREKSSVAPSIGFDGNGRVTMHFHDVWIVPNPTFNPGEWRFDPIAPEAIRAGMIADIEKFSAAMRIPAASEPAT